MKRERFTPHPLLAALIMGGILLSLFGRYICLRVTKNYEDLQPELFAPDKIAAVLYDKDQQQLYVCYSDASYVNVYTESGDFLWAVSTPYFRNVRFELQDGHLIIYRNDAYIYDAADGRFIDCVDAHDLDLAHNWESTSRDALQDGEFYFSTYQVYKTLADGTAEAVVTRPWWYWCFHFFVGWSIAFFAAIGIGITLFLGKRKAYVPLKKRVKLKNRKLKVIFHYFRITAAVHLTYTVFNISLCLFARDLWSYSVFGLFALAAHFLISAVILWSMLDSISAPEDETAVLTYWKAVEVGSFLIAFLSFVAGGFIAG